MSSLLSMQTLLPLLVGLPLVAAILTTILTGRRLCAWVSILFALAQLGAAITLVSWLRDNGLNIESPDPIRYAFGGWGAPLGIDLVVDGFSALMVALTTLLVLILSIYSYFYFTDAHKASRFWPLWWLLVTGLNALFLSADMFNIYVTLEIIGLSAVALVALQGNRDALTAALRYLLVGLSGSLCYLLGVALLYRSYGTLDLTQLSAIVEPSALTGVSLALISVGLVLKTALFPLHFWLPLAHGSAPAPISAALSALVVKASFYLLARFWLDVLEPATTEAGLLLLGVLGSMAIIWGSVQALRAHRLKLIVAYSTVAQLGYLFLLFPLQIGASAAVGQNVSSLNAVAYFILAHACAKAAMFLAAGNIVLSEGHDDVRRLSGLASRMPLSLFTFAIAGASLIGLPPSAGFIAKWLLLNATIDSEQWWWLIVILAGGLLAASYLFRVLNIGFSSPEDHDSVLPSEKLTMKKLHPVMSLCGFALAMMAIFFGFNAQWIIDLLNLNPLSTLSSLVDNRVAL
jgi:multicomponent Na+:H+ antiporter subunit D